MLHLHLICFWQVFFDFVFKYIYFIDHVTCHPEISKQYYIQKKDYVQKIFFPILGASAFAVNIEML